MINDGIDGQSIEPMSPSSLDNRKLGVCPLPPLWRRPWPNLMQILSILLKLQAVKQSGPGFLAFPVYSSCSQALSLAICKPMT